MIMHRPNPMSSPITCQKNEGRNGSDKQDNDNVDDTRSPHPDPTTPSIVHSARRKAIEALQRAYEKDANNTGKRSSSLQMKPNEQTLDEVVRSTQALLSTNNEIWDRCRSNKFLIKSAAQLPNDEKIGMKFSSIRSWPLVLCLFTLRSQGILRSGWRHQLFSPDLGCAIGFG